MPPSSVLSSYYFNLAFKVSWIVSEASYRAFDRAGNQKHASESLERSVALLIFLAGCISSFARIKEGERRGISE